MYNKWLFASWDDWANVGYSLSKAMQSIGKEARAVSLHKLEGNYMVMDEVCSRNRYREYAGESDVIVAMHSTYEPVDLTGKKFMVFHGGTIYREFSSRLNNYFNSMVDATLIQTGDLLDKGAKNQHWILPPIDTDMLQPDYEYHGGIFAHYPSKSYMKNTRDILDTVHDIRYSSDFVNWKENIDRIRECDIYIEQMTKAWGISALEAAALGKVVITSFEDIDDYEKEYGKCELIIANDKEELQSIVDDIRVWDKDKLLTKKMATRKWVEDLHSFEAVGNRLLNVV